MRTNKNATYKAYLIRCWYEDGSWRFALETIGQDRRQHGFNSLAMLTEHLQSKLDEATGLLLTDSS